MVKPYKVGARSESRTEVKTTRNNWQRGKQRVQIFNDTKSPEDSKNREAKHKKREGGKKRGKGFFHAECRANCQ
jgi:hypothetical protein